MVGRRIGRWGVSALHGCLWRRLIVIVVGFLVVFNLVWLMFGWTYIKVCVYYRMREMGVY